MTIINNITLFAAYWICTYWIRYFINQ